MWLVAPATELVRGRRWSVHNNLHWRREGMGAIYTDQDVVVDGDLVTGRTGGHCHLFARKIIDMIARRRRQRAGVRGELRWRSSRFITSRFRLRQSEDDRSVLHEALRLHAAPARSRSAAATRSCS